MKVAERFSARHDVFWATTYTFEPEIFEEYLLRRLGQPPLNAVVLVDFERHRNLFADATPRERRVLRANRDYLLRPVPAGGAFHPKTYFFANRTEGELLVGSGNLTLNGVEQGFELFSSFRSADADGVAAIRAWRDWMSGLVDDLADDHVRERWLDARSRTPWMAGIAPASAFVTNRDVPLAAQLLAGVATPVDELHALAPYFDPDARALAGLIEECAPQKLCLYLGDRVSVRGPKLREVLDAAPCDVELIRFEPSRFVHAKLMAIVTGDSARILTGSANLSLAALRQSYSDTSTANVEAGVLRASSAKQLRSLLQEAPGLELAALADGVIDGLEFTPTRESAAPPVALLWARCLDDGRIEVRMGGDLPAGTLYLSDGDRHARLSAGITVEAFPLSEDTRLVWIEDAHRTVLSNRVPPDHTARLRSRLREASQHGGERPSEINAADAATPLGQVLIRLHNEAIFDFDDTDAARRGQRIAGETTGAGGGDEDGDWSFVERILRDEIRYDRRAMRYDSLDGVGGLTADDPVILLLEMMTSEVPSRPQLRLLLGLPASPPGGKGTPWTMDQRREVRLFNVLQRWSRALSDPRLRWINPFAPVRNYAALLTALAACHEEHHLSEPRLAELTGTLLESFASPVKPVGYLFALDDEERAQALKQLPDRARSLQAALAYVAIRPRAAWRTRVLAWKPTLVAAHEQSLFLPDSTAADAVNRMVSGDRAATAAAVGERLTWATTYVDDRDWCERVATELGLGELAFVTKHVRTGFPVRLRVTGLQLESAALVPLIRKALAFRNTERVTIDLPKGGWVAVAVDKETAFAEVHGEKWVARETIDGSALEALEELGEGLTAVMSRRTSSAA